MFKNDFLRAGVFCSNSKNLDELAINFLTLINSLLTFTLSNALDFVCNVFCPNTTIPCPGNVAIGLTLDLYNESLCEFKSVLSVFKPVTFPLFIPAGANQGLDTLSLKDMTSANATEGGTHLYLVLLSMY